MRDSDVPRDWSSDLQDAFEDELMHLAATASRKSMVEGVMRLRALAEIANTLDTADLLELAVKVEAGHRPAGSGASRRGKDGG